VIAPQVDLRLAAVQAASTAKNPIVVSTLKTGVSDRVFEIRFTAAEGLATFNAEKAAAVPVLVAALESKDADVQGRAQTALVKLGEKVADTAPTPDEMLDSTDRRCGSRPTSCALPASEGCPAGGVWRTRVRRCGAPGWERRGPGDQDKDRRSSCAGLVDADLSCARRPRDSVAARPAAAEACCGAGAGSGTGSVPVVDDTLPKVKAARRGERGRGRGQTALNRSRRSRRTSRPRPRSPRAMTRRSNVELLATNLGKRDEAQAAAVKTAAQAVSGPRHGPSPDRRSSLPGKRAREGGAKPRPSRVARPLPPRNGRASTSRPRPATPDVRRCCRCRDRGGQLQRCEQNLDKATGCTARRGRKAGIDYSYAQLYDKMTRARRSGREAQAHQQARRAYEQFAKPAPAQSATRTARAAESPTG
jgi:hypothetical protein